MVVAVAMVAAVAATEGDRSIRGVAIISGELARALEHRPAPIRAGELLGHSGEFRAGEFLYVTTRGKDGGQSTLGIGTAAIDFGALRQAAPTTVVIDALALLWPGATSGESGGD